MDTEEIMQISLEMAGFDETPPDSAIYVPGKKNLISQTTIRLIRFKI